MNAEVPTPEERPRKRKRVVKSNGTQIFLFAVLTVILTVAAVWGGRIWLKNAETLVFAVGDPTSPEARFAKRLETLLRNNTSRLQLKILSSPDSSKALGMFERREANLAVLRTTDSRIPSHARALAILDRDLMLLLSPNGKKVKTVAELRKKKIAVLSDSDGGAPLVRSLLEIPDAVNGVSSVQMAPPGSTFEKLFASGSSAVVAIVRTSRLIKDPTYEQSAKRGAFTLNAIDAAKGLARRNPALSADTISAGTLSSSPAIPEEDVETIGLQWLLVASSRLSPVTAGDLTRTIYENKAELARLRAEYNSRQATRDDLNRRVATAQQDASHIQQTIGRLRERLGDYIQARNATRAENPGASTAAMDAEIARLNQQIAALEAQLAELNSAISITRTG